MPRRERPPRVRRTGLTQNRTALRPGHHAERPGRAVPAALEVDTVDPSRVGQHPVVVVHHQRVGFERVPERVHRVHELEGSLVTGVVGRQRNADVVAFMRVDRRDDVPRDSTLSDVVERLHGTSELIRRREGGRHRHHEPEPVRAGGEARNQNRGVKQREVHPTPDRYLVVSVPADVVREEERVKRACLERGGDLLPIRHLPPLVPDLLFGLDPTETRRRTGAVEHEGIVMHRPLIHVAR